MSFDLNASFSPSSEYRSMKSIALFVIVVHFGLLGIGTLSNRLHPIPTQRSKMIVQTVHLNSFEKKMDSHLKAPAPAPPLSQQEEVPVQQEPIPKNEEVPPVIIPKEIPTKPIPSTDTSLNKKVVPVETKKVVKQKVVPVKKSAESTKKNQTIPTTPTKDQLEKKREQERIEKEKKHQQEQLELERKHQQEMAKQKERALLAKAKENLAKMSETRDKISTPSSVNLEKTTLPKELILQVDALPLDNQEQWGIKEANYSDEVAYRLRQSLKLPDYGAVKIKLTLDRTGKVVKVETIQSASVKNQAYVESKIPHILFSSFGQRFEGLSQNTFTFTLQNDS